MKFAGCKSTVMPTKIFSSARQLSRSLNGAGTVMRFSLGLSFSPCCAPTSLLGCRRHFGGATLTMNDGSSKAVMAHLPLVNAARHNSNRAVPKTRRTSSKDNRRNAKRSRRPTTRREDAQRPTAEVPPTVDTTEQNVNANTKSDRGQSSSTAPLPWTYDVVHPSTGKTSLEERFDSSVQKIREIFDQPLPELPVDDGSIEPDLLVGFAFYNFRLRDQYRAVIARTLQLHPSDVALSVGWSGRFDVSRFSNCQKVCGVRIATHRRGGGGGDEGNVPNSSSSSHPLSDELKKRIDAFVHAARKRLDESLLNLHIINAATALKEVQFAQRSKEIDAMGAFLRDYLLFTRYQVVIVHNNGSSEAEQRWVDSRGQKMFRDRKVVPHVVSVQDICNAVMADLATTTTTEGEFGGSVVRLNLHQALREMSKSSDPTAAGLPSESHVKGLVHAALSKACGGASRFPAVFCNSAHLGSTPQLAYLQKNTRALDAILLRPNDISFAKRHLSNLGGDQRRRETLAADAAHGATGRVHH